MKNNVFKIIKSTFIFILFFVSILFISSNIWAEYMKKDIKNSTDYYIAEKTANLTLSKIDEKIYAANIDPDNYIPKIIKINEIQNVVLSVCDTYFIASFVTPINKTSKLYVELYIPSEAGATRYTIRDWGTVY